MKMEYEYATGKKKPDWMREVKINGEVFIPKAKYDDLLLALETQEIRIKALERKTFKGCKR